MTPKEIQEANGLIEDIKEAIRANASRPKRSVLSTHALFCLPKSLWPSIEDQMLAAFNSASAGLLTGTIVGKTGILKSKFNIDVDIATLETEVAAELEEQKQRREAPDVVDEKGDC